jgi:transposase
VAEHVEEPSELVVGIETDRGLLVGSLVEAGYHVYAINPLAASRYRDRHAVSRAKSDPADAKVLAELVRTDRQNHREVAVTPSSNSITASVSVRGRERLPDRSRCTQLDSTRKNVRR